MGWSPVTPMIDYDGPKFLAVVIISDEDEEQDWYDCHEGGGFEVPFGDFNGWAINRTPIAYLEQISCSLDDEFREQYEPFFDALDMFLTGLREYAKHNYSDFIVPYGKHRGKKIKQCRDKDWLNWVVSEPGLSSPLPVFLEAVHYHLANPRHYEQYRDIGHKTKSARNETPNSDTDDDNFINDGDPNDGSTEDEVTAVTPIKDEGPITEDELLLQTPRKSQIKRKGKHALGYTYRSGVGQTASSQSFRRDVSITTVPDSEAASSEVEEPFTPSASRRTRTRSAEKEEETATESSDNENKTEGAHDDGSFVVSDGYVSYEDGFLENNDKKKKPRRKLGQNSSSSSSTSLRLKQDIVASTHDDIGNQDDGGQDADDSECSVVGPLRSHRCTPITPLPRYKAPQQQRTPPDSRSTALSIQASSSHQSPRKRARKETASDSSQSDEAEIQFRQDVKRGKMRLIFDGSTELSTPPPQMPSRHHSPRKRARKETASQSSDDEADVQSHQDVKREKLRAISEDKDGVTENCQLRSAVRENRRQMDDDDGDGDLGLDGETAMDLDSIRAAEDTDSAEDEDEVEEFGSLANVSEAQHYAFRQRRSVDYVDRPWNRDMTPPGLPSLIPPRPGRSRMDCVMIPWSPYRGK